MQAGVCVVEEKVNKRVTRNGDGLSQIEDLQVGTGFAHVPEQVHAHIAPGIRFHALNTKHIKLVSILEKVKPDHPDDHPRNPKIVSIVDR